MVTPDVRQQYQTTDPLRIRIETHVQYSERQSDLHAACHDALGLTGTESLLDVGCGPGDWPRYLRQRGHTGRLAGLDQSEGMIAAATASAAGLDIEWFTGVADALPFPDASFAVVSARHMLYHVPDISAALRECARVAGPTGTVFATTNSLRDLPHLMALRDDMLAHFGLPAIPSMSLAFGIENAPRILGEIFPHVDETILRNAFLFNTLEPIVAYIMTMIPVQQTAHDPTLHNAIRTWLHDEATQRLAAMGGAWRDPKNVGLYCCRA